MQCSYNCGQEAKHQLKNGKWCCHQSANSCPINKKRNSELNRGRPSHWLGKKKGPLSEEHKNKLRKPRSPETKERMRQSENSGRFKKRDKKSMRTQPELCDYGCGQKPKYHFKNDMWCCSKNSSSCSAIREKNGNGNRGKKRLPRTEEWKIKQSKAQKKPRSEKFKETCREAQNRLDVKEKHKKTALIVFNLPEVKERLSKAQKEVQNRPEVQQKKRIAMLKLHQDLNSVFNTEEYKKNGGMSGKKQSIKGIETAGKRMKIMWRDPEWRKLIIEKVRKRMLNGGALKALSGNKNPSKGQVELFNLVRSWFPQARLNYPLGELNYSLDIGLPDLKIWLEYDGSYWHKKRKEEDLKRQKQIEELGWNCIRYIDKVPTDEEFIHEIRRFT